jgi:hypothetical protein
MPFQDAGAMLAAKQGAGNPMKMAIDMTEKMWSKVVQANPKMGSYVARAMAILKAGLEESSNQKPDGAQQSENGGEVPKGPGPGAMPA